MSEQISVIDLKVNTTFVVPSDGKYLVKTVSETDKTVNGSYKRVNWFSCTVKRHYDEKKNLWSNHFGCNNQIVVAVSEYPLDMV